MTDVSTQAIPNDYVNALEYIAPGITAIFDQTPASGTSWTDTMTALLPNLQITTQQTALINLELARADQGLPAQQVDASGNPVSSNLLSNPITLLLLGIGAMVALK